MPTSPSRRPTPTDPPSRAHRTLAAAAALAAALTAACTTAPTSPPNDTPPNSPNQAGTPPAPFTPRPNPIALLPGSTLAVPLTADAPDTPTDRAEPAPTPAPINPATLASTGRTLRTTIVALVQKPADRATNAPAWLPPTRAIAAIERTEYLAGRNTTDPPPTPLAWYALIELPADAPPRPATPPDADPDATPTGSPAPATDAVTLAGTAIPLAFVTTASPDQPTPAPATPDTAQSAAPPLTPPTPTAAQRDRLADRLTPLLRSSTNWWRLELLAESRPDLITNRLRQRLATARDNATPASRDLADAVTHRWRAALTRLNAADPDTARRLRDRLTAVARLHTGEFVPAWPPPDPSLNDLLRVLTLPAADDERLIDRTDIEFRRHPPVALHIIDDAGSRFAEGKPRNQPGPLEPGFDPTQSEFSFARPAPARAVRQITAAITELRNRPTWASLASPNLSGSVGVALPPLDSRTARLDGAAAAEHRAATLEARVGPRRVTANSPARPVPTQPPGLRIGPLAEPHNLTTWWTNATRLPPPQHRTAAALFKSPDGWTLYTEALRPETPNQTRRNTPDEDPPEPHTDTLLVYLGAYDPADTPLEIRPPEIGTTETRTTPTGFSITTTATHDRWRAWITLPPTVTNNAEFLLGLARTDQRGVRTAWPRPLVPGQTTPGRRRIDLTAWKNPDEHFDANAPLARP